VNVERGVRRLLIVITGLVLTLPLLAVLMGGDVGSAIAFAAGVIAILWVAFYTLRWIARGFMQDSEPQVRRPPVRWKTVKNWLVIGIAGAALAWLGVVLLAALWDFLQHPVATWHAVVSGFSDGLVRIWRRLAQVVGNTAATTIVVAFVALATLGLVSEWWDALTARRQRRAYRRLTEHYANCGTCQQPGHDDDDLDGPDGYCPIGRQLYAEWSRS
jgi:hypothetical protein